MRLARPLRLVVCTLSLLTSAVLADDWPQFRGPHRDNISRETGLLHKWPAGGPKVLWSTPVCQGYAAAAIHSGRVYFNDYDMDAGEWYVRCLTLSEGQEQWRFAEKKRIRPNHGITRTVPAVDGKYVFSLDPKCVFHCLDAQTGQELWQKNLVTAYNAQIPPWYNGQNPLIASDRVILGIGGEALLIAFDKATGKELWQTPNPEHWPLAHSSVMPATLGGVDQYVWCTLFGPVGVRARDGVLLWHLPRKFNVAVAPSPLRLGDDRVFMTSGYDAGSVMLRVARDGDRFTATALFELTAEQWNSEVHTPIWYLEHMFAVGRKSRGLFTCLDPNGTIAWTSADKASFDLGGFILADGMFFVLDGKTATLRLLEANTKEYRELDAAQVLSGDNVWAPPALSNGKLIVRDMAKMVCLEVGSTAEGTEARRHEGTEGEKEGTQARRHAGTEGGGNVLVCSVGPPSPTLGATAPLRYRKARVLELSGDGQSRFQEAARGLAIDRADMLYVAGDSKVARFDWLGESKLGCGTNDPAYCVAIAADGTTFVGGPGFVLAWGAGQSCPDSWRDPEKFGLVTSIGFLGDEVIVADAKGKALRRCDQKGRVLGNIGRENLLRRGFMLPNRYLDFAIDPNGTILACNPGMHRVQRFSAQGELLGHFGRFDSTSPEGFPGCCNPTNIALTPTGDIVVTEKAPPRVKVYTPAGKLRAAFGTEDFDEDCKNMDIAVDSHGRIYVLDTERLAVVVYEPEDEGTSQPALTHPQQEPKDGPGTLPA
jgi:outer membrane protein assembly factor BamB